MATRNDVTGDKIQSKVNSDAYRDNWEAIFSKADGDEAGVSDKEGTLEDGLFPQDQAQGC
jgi:hypothetical protein